jgi:hypothetical protein
MKIAVVNLGQPIDVDIFGDLMLRYQTQIRPDLPHYTEQDRQAMGDGSWLLTGLRQAPGEQTQQVNTFIERDGSFFAVIEVVLPPDGGLRANLQSIVNTFDINPDADLPVSELPALGGAARMGLVMVNVTSWVTPGGVFFITGEVANNSAEPVSDVPVRAALWAADERGVGEAVDVVMGYALPPGGFAPFSLRFGARPPEADFYTLTLGGETWMPGEARTIADPTMLNWTDESSYNQNGHLLITGSVTNTGDQSVREPRAVVTVFDEARNVIAAAFSDADRALLPPGETANYTVLIPEFGGPPVNYIVEVQALPLE